MRPRSTEPSMPANLSKPLPGKRLRSNETLPERDMDEWFMSTVAAARLPAQSAKEPARHFKNNSTKALKSAQPPVETQRRPKRNLELDSEETDLLPPKRARLLGGAPRRCRRVVEDSDEEDNTAGQSAKEAVENSNGPTSIPTTIDEVIAEKPNAATESSVEPTEEITEDNNGCTSSPFKAGEAVAKDNSATAGQMTKEITEKNSSELADGPRESVEATSEETDTTIKSSEPTRSSPKSENAAHDEKSAEDSSSSEPTSSSTQTSGTPDSGVEVTPLTSMPEVSKKAAESGTKGPSKTASEQSTRSTEKIARSISGLFNNSNQCFSNSVIQLYDAALDGHDLDAVLGEVGSIKPFQEPLISLDDRYNDPPKKARGSKANNAGGPLLSKLRNVKNGIKERITKSRDAKKLKEISPKKHLRLLLHRLRQHKGDGRSKQVTAFLFQHILAHGDEAANRQHLDGEQQQDCYEYFQAMMDGVDSSAGDDTSSSGSSVSSASLSSLFEITSETATVCKNPDCDYKGEVTPDVSTSVDVAVPNMKEAAFLDLLDASNASELGGTACPKCKLETLERITELTEASDNLVFSLKRTGYDGVTKIKTPVVLPMQPIQISGKEFVLNAVLRHKGCTAEGGHYTILRRRSPEWFTETKSLWWKFDDGNIKGIDKSDVRDGYDGAQSVMLLFKAL